MPKTPPLRLAFGPMFWRMFLVFVILAEVGLWAKLQPFLKKRDTGSQVAAMLFHSPKRIFRSFAWAALATVIADGYVRLVLRPVNRRWYSPRRRDVEFGTPLEFLLAPRESIVGELPGRLVIGRCTEPGRLVRTDRRVLFCPLAWDAEPWSVVDSDLVAVSPVPTKALMGSLVLGTPDRVLVRTTRGADALFAVADPEDVFGLFSDSLVRRSAGPPREPSPLELL